MRRRSIALWISLVLLRLLVALTSTSTIHPDEHFQNPEITAGDAFDYVAGEREALLRTWEWDSASPCRSVVPAWLSTGIAFHTLKVVVGPSPSGHAIFLTERLAMWVLSLLGDYTVWIISRSRVALLIYATAPVTFTFLLRPFSNSLETFVLGGLFALAPRHSDHTTIWRLVGLGVLAAIGAFTRITTVAFALPLAFATMTAAATPEKRTRPLNRFGVMARRLLPALCSFIGTSAGCILIDSLYFDAPSSAGSPNVTPRFILTPLNLLRYNTNAKNLAEHGLHPRYLHALVNSPMLFGAGLYIIFDTLCQAWRASKEPARSSRLVYLATFFVPLLALSFQPHQEPRFLVPLVIPIALLAPSTRLFSGAAQAQRRRRRWFWALWLVHSSIFTMLFAYLHQGGLTPAVMAINQSLRDHSSSASTPTEVHVVFWKTFMPPRRFLLPLQGLQTFQISDLSGAPLATLLDTLSGPESESRTASLISQQVLVAPAWAFDRIHAQLALKLKIHPLFDGRTFGVHVDMDRIDEMLDSSWDRSGVGVWKLSSRR